MSVKSELFELIQISRTNPIEISLPIDKFFKVKANIDTELDYAEKCHNLEEEIGCPLDVRCKVVKNTSIFAELGYRKISNEWLVGEISSDGFICWQKYAIRRYFWKDYKKTWWLKKDKSE